MEFEDMGKRSTGTFKRVARDFYPTPEAAVIPLLPHLQSNTTFDEPCAGDGSLINHLKSHGLLCFGKSDIEPQRDDINNYDVFDIDLLRAECFITNPPWDRKILHPLIVHLSDLGPTWLLFDADWMHTKQSAEYMDRCVKVVSVGRLKWIPDSKMTGKDNCCWYLFDAKHEGTTEFIGR